ncbi:MAG TPA: EamA family transporter [Bacillota bacterium]|jgi:drug/metabolite transporter (DMT)-like permease|nr:EamA family transporter [Bacillota bacterium]HOL10596.1 EamA family transporter [Bacillota bacterium]HPO97423.1 EamA family transporter [Bacillota bacterium]
MNKQHQGLLYLIVTVILFSTFEVSSKLIGSRLHPLQISLFRFLIGGLILFPVACYRVHKTALKIDLNLIFSMFLLGIVNIVISMSLIQFGLKFTSASNAAVIFSSNPLFVAFFAALMLKEKVSTNKIIGMIIGVTGVFLLFADQMGERTLIDLGSGLVLLSAIFFALYTVIGKQLTLRNIDSLVMTSFSFLAGSLCLIPIMWVMEVPVYVNNRAIIPHILYLGIFVSGLAYMCYFYGLRSINTSAGSLIYFVKPPLATLFSIVIVKETVSVHFFIGTIVILFGLVIISFERFSEMLENKLYKLLDKS